MVLTRNWGGGRGTEVRNYCLMGKEFQRWMVVMFAQCEGYLMSLNCVLKMAKMVHFTLCIFYYSKKKKGGDREFSRNCRKLAK